MYPCQWTTILGLIISGSSMDALHFFGSNSTGIFISQETYKYIKLARKNKKISNIMHVSLDLLENKN